MRNIWIAGDLFRFARRSDGLNWVPRRNVEILKSILDGAVGWRGDVRVNILDHAALGISEQEFVEEHGLESGADAWHRASWKPLPSGLEQAIEKTIENAVVVSFEATEPFWKLLTLASDIALDLCLHPCRFAPDFLLLGRSVGIDLDSLADRKSVRQALWWSAAIIKADVKLKSYCRGGLNNALIALQVPTDKALMNEQGFVNFTDHIEKIKQISNEVNIVFIKPHPGGVMLAEDAESFVVIENAIFINENIYRLMSSGEVGCVYSISSSVLHEAEYFGVSSEALDSGLSFGVPIREELYPIRLRDLVGPVAGVLSGCVDDRVDIEGPNTVLRDLFGDASNLIGLNEALPPPPIPGNRMLASSSDLTPALTAGWAQQEHWGVWGVGPANVVTLQWPDPGVNVIKLAIEACIYPKDLESEWVSIYSRGVELVRIKLWAQNIGVSRFIINLLTSIDGLNAQFSFLNINAISPQELYGIPDIRPLSVGLISIERVG